MESSVPSFFQQLETWINDKVQGLSNTSEYSISIHILLKYCNYVLVYQLFQSVES